MKKVSLFAVAVIAFIISCNIRSGRKTIVASEAATIDTAHGSCPYLTRDNNDNIVISWIRKRDTTASVFCYAVSDDKGKTFRKAVEIPISTNVHPHGENMPKVVFKPSGEVIAVWGGANPNPKNAYSGLVYYSQSFDNGKSWSEATPLTKDTTSFDQRYFDVALLPDGEAGIVWLDNRKNMQKEGSGLYYATTKGDYGFQNEKLVSEPCCQCCRTDLFIDRNKNIHVIYRAIINDSIRDMVHIVSTDDGQSFSQPNRISQDDWVINGCPHTGPAITENKQGIHFTWFTGGRDAGIYYNHSTNDGVSFSARNGVAGKSSKHCQITALADDHILIVWNESFPQGNDFSSRIGIDMRDENGKEIMKDYITAENSRSSYPVICPVSDDKVVIAYTEEIDDKERVMLKQVSFE